MSRRSLAAAALLTGLAAAALFFARSRGPRSAGSAGGGNPMGTQRLLDDPGRLQVSVGADPSGGRRGAPRKSRLWDAQQLDKEWSRTQASGAITLRSPRLDFGSPDEVDSIVIRFAELGGLRRFSLLWSGEPSLDWKSKLRNRRELPVLGSPPQRGFWVRGDELAYVPLLRGEPGKGPLRYVFLRLPADPAPAPRLESVAVIGKRDILAAQSHGPVRHTLRGETRTAYHLATPGRLRYRMRRAGPALLSFGLLGLDAEAAIRCSVTLGSGADAAVLFERRIGGAGRAWRDFQVALPPTREEASLTLSAESDAPHDGVLLSNPTILDPSRAAAHPNVVLYVVDGLRPDRLGFSGYAKQTSPFLDSLARSGVAFRSAYAQAAWTKPSVATLLTSLYPQTHGVGARSSLDALPESVVTLQDLLRSHGYLTAQFTANAFASNLSNLDQGFDWSFGPDAFEIEDAAAKKNKLHSDDLNARLLPWLEAHAAGRFFVYVHSIDPHPPCSLPRTPRALPGGDTESDLYDEEVRFNDDQLRALHDRLVELGMAKDTLLVVTADHGEAFGEHGRAGHGLSVHQEEIRIPLLFARPGVLAPRVVDAPAQAVDVMPTILRLSAVPFDAARLQGRDLLGASEQAQRSRRAFASRFVYPDAIDMPEFFGQEQLAVIEDGSKLIVRRRADGAPRLELFDLVADPGERRDRSAVDPARAELLQRALDDFLERQQAARTAFLAAHPHAAAAASPGGRRLLPQDVLERLQALGYLK